MRILQLGKFYPVRGGVEKVMSDLTRGLGDRGVECDMLCASLPPQEPGVIPYGAHSRVICVPAIVKKSATMISPAMISYLKRHHDYDIIHIHHPDPMATLALRLSGYRGKVVLHWHSDIIKQKSLLKFYLPLQKWFLERADVIIGTSEKYIEESPFLTGYRHKALAVPIGVPQVIGEPGKVFRIREKMGGRKMVFSLGRFVEYKGYEYLVEAVKELPDDYILVMGGDGPLRDEMMARAEYMGLSARIIFPGRIPDSDLSSWISACDVFVLSSVMKSEAFAVVQVEAMSCGKPVVATRIPGSGVSWVNADGVSGINVPVRNSSALAEAIRDVCSDSGKYELFSANARKRYLELFTLDKMIDSCIEVYNSLLK